MAGASANSAIRSMNRAFGSNGSAASGLLSARAIARFVGERWYATSPLAACSPTPAAADWRLLASASATELSVEELDSEQLRASSRGVNSLVSSSRASDS